MLSPVYRCQHVILLSKLSLLERQSCCLLQTLDTPAKWGQLAMAGWLHRFSSPTMIIPSNISAH